LEAGKNPRRQQTIEIDYNFNPPEIAGETSVALAASTILRTESVLARKILLHRSFVEASLQGQAIKTVYAEISDLEAAGKLVLLDRHKAGQRWTTATIAEEEAKLLRLVQERVHGSWFRPEAVEAALEAASYLSVEQRNLGGAIEHDASLLFAVAQGAVGYQDPASRGDCRARRLVEWAWPHSILGTVSHGVLSLL